MNQLGRTAALIAQYEAYSAQCKQRQMRPFCRVCWFYSFHCQHAADHVLEA